MMKIPSLNELIRSKLLIAGLVFIGVNIWFSYSFYQVNSFKILLVLIGVSVLVVWNDLLFPRNVEKQFPWKQVFIVSIPLLATMPGILWFQGDYNYNFRYELASNLVLIIWIAYLYRGTQSKEDLFPFFFFVGVIVIYAGLWAVLERIGYHPMYWGEGSVSRVKSTFGNINYFAGFLVVLTPLLLSLLLPNTLRDLLSLKNLFPTDNKAPIFYSIVFLFAAIGLFFTQTRAAQGATIVSLVAVTFFYIYAFIRKDYKTKVIIIGIALVILGVLSFILLFALREHLPENRFTNLLFIEGWTPRFAGWVPAINSIQASPFIGFGLGSSYNLYFSFTDPDARLIHAEHSYNHVHSEFLEYIQEAGFIGLILFLLFWCYMAYLLFKTIGSEQTDPLLKKIAVGIIGGFVGYHFHSAFSVAPRMMVVKLPLFTLIGLTLILAKLSFQQKAFTVNKDVLDRVKSFLPSLVIICFVWIIFTPWLIGQNSFIKIRRSRTSLTQVEKLEKLVKKYPDAYALDHLSHMQIQYKRTSQLQETVSIIDDVLPHYRELGYTKSLLALMQKDVLKGKQLALEFQEKRDRYHKANIFLLMGLAFDTADFKLFKRQLELYTRKLIFDKRLFYSLHASDVEIQFSIMDLPFEFKEQDNGMFISWNEKLVRRLYNTGRSVRMEATFSPNDRNTLIKLLSFQFIRHPYFKLQIKESYKDKGSKEINQHMRDYYLISQQSTRKSIKLTKEYREVLIKTKPSERKALQKKQSQERAKVLKPFQEKQAKHSEFLRERTDWDTFQKKRGFINDFINNLDALIFPRMKTN